MTPYGLRADVIPEQFQAEGVLDALADRPMEGARVLIPRALVAREILPDQLRARGAEVDVVPAYRTIRPTVAVDRLKEQLRGGVIDVLSFTSSSTVRNFVELFASPQELQEAVGGTTVACIGPITAGTAREAGFVVQVVAAENTVPALAEAMVQHAEGRHRAAAAASQ